MPDVFDCLLCLNRLKYAAMMDPTPPHPRSHLAPWPARPVADPCDQEGPNHASAPPPIEAAPEEHTKGLFPSRSATTKIKEFNMLAPNASGTSELLEAEL